MNNQIKGLTPKEDKEFDDRFKYSQFVDYSAIKPYTVHLLHKREETIREKIEELRYHRPTNSLEYVVYALRKNLRDAEKEHVSNRDNGLYIKMVCWAEREETVGKVLAFLSDTQNKKNHE